MARGSIKRGIFLIGKLQKVFMDTAPYKSNGFYYPLLVTDLSIRNFMSDKKINERLKASGGQASEYEI